MTSPQRLKHYETLQLPQADPSIDYNIWENKLITPVDDRGLVEVFQLIDNVKATVDPEYLWEGQYDVHHIYWRGSWYPQVLNAPVNPDAFRNLPIHKALVYRSFHEWLEKVTIPPEVPPDEAMRYRCAAWDVSRSLFKMARKTIQGERLAQRRKQLIMENPELVGKGFDGSDPIAEEIMAEIFEKKFRGVEMHKQRNEKIPEEYRLIDLDQPMDEIAKKLGRIVMKPSINLLPVLRAA